MEMLIKTILQISLSTAAVLGILLLLVPILQTWYSARWRKVLWLVIAIRLLIPFSLALPSAPVQMHMELDAAPLLWQLPEQNNLSLDDGIATKGPAAEPVSPAVQASGPYRAAAEADSLSGVTIKQTLSRGMLWFIIWLLGAVLFLVWHGSWYLRFQRNVLRVAHMLPEHEVLLQRISQDMKLRCLPKVLVSSNVQGPMLTGFLKPVILLPSRIYGEQELRLILRHELIHHQQKDLWYKLVLLGANAVHWFNPLIYLLIRQASRDLEQVCDEQVVKGQDLNYRKAYSLTILKAMSSSRGIALSTYLSKQAQNSKKRFAAILRPGSTSGA